ncbi:MAG: polyphosphate polymerase domain-containing protein [Oscillospiraceae bacterium]|nr:polyphosphate polymerase domain-containing protein [Oscillospiraceae bacterium]
MKERQRHEIKYYIHPVQYEILRGRVGAALSRDPHMPDADGYHVRSLYFDDIYDSALKEKLSGIEKRKKYRARIYDLRRDDIRLECKKKEDVYITKRTLRIDEDTYNQLLDNRFCCAGIEMPPDFTFDFKTKILRPVVIVDYMREAYIYAHGNVRITFDKRLETSVDSLDIFDKEIFTTRVFEDDLVVLEIKFDAFLPSFIKDLLRVEHFNKCAISKYALCRQKMYKHFASGKGAPN